MAFVYEAGPLAYLDPSRFPDRVAVDGEMATVVATPVAQLGQAEGYTGARVSEIAGAGVPDVHGETVAVLTPAVQEIGHQLGTLHDLSSSRVVSAAGGALGDADRVRADLPSEDSEWRPPPVPGEGAVNPVEPPEPGERPEI